MEVVAVTEGAAAVTEEAEAATEEVHQADNHLPVEEVLHQMVEEEVLARKVVAEVPGKLDI